MKKLLLIGFTLTITGVLFAQQSQDKTYPVLLTNQTLQYSFNENAPQKLGVRPAEVVNGYVYRIVQLKGIQIGPNEMGFTALEYLPKYAAIARIPVTSYESVQNQLHARGGWMSRLEPSMKLSRQLFQNNIPEWAWIDQDHFKAWVRYYPGLDHQGVREGLRENGFPILEEKPDADLFSIILHKDLIDVVSSLPYLMHVQEMEDPGKPENYTARTNHRVNTLQSLYPGAPAYDGTGVTVGIGDDGVIGPHIDYEGRLTQNASSSTGDHGDHVAGTVFGAGNLDPKGAGMAPGADVYYQSYPDNLSDADINYNSGVRITNSSYSNGCNAGYTNFTRQMDQDLQDNPTLIHVFSAGNNGTSNCNYGAGAGWGNVTGGHKIAKNVIATANLTHLDVLANSSSRGPASDGRVKPDVAAVGVSVFSTTNPNAYTLKTGTSMASPGVAGVMAVLYQAYRDKNSGADPQSGLLKGILMNTADDIGNAGPDFRYGYGRINARRAYEVIEGGNHITDNLTSGSTKNFQLTVPANTSEARIMLYWPDVPGSTIASRALVNDLDLTVTYGGNTIRPWVLDPTPNANALNSLAVRARDSLNNMEQVTINNPSGTLSVNISGFNIPSGPQEFYIIYEFVPDEVILTYPIGGEGLVPGETEYIRWDAPAGNSNFSLEYSTDAGLTWQFMANVLSTRRYHTWTVPNVTDGDYKVRVGRGGQFSVSPGTFNVIGVPSNLNVARSCPDSLLLTWNSVTNANGYVIYKLGNKYMDSIGTTTNNFFNVNINNPLKEDWYSVAAIAPSGTAGRRAIAINKPSGIFNCALANDLQLTQLISPASDAIPDCFNYNNVPVTVRLFNNGSNDLTNFPVSYSFNNGPVITATVTDTLLAGQSLDFTFIGSSVSLNPGVNYNITVYSGFSLDDNRYNDTIVNNLQTYSSSLASFPLAQDFENFNNCSTNNNCGQTVCNLRDGWFNPTNGVTDDIDWRTNSGPTPSNFTGPSVDHKPGSGNGKYLYLEASNGCDSSEAWLMSPCIDLSSAVSPTMDFWYHMYGNDMGTLRIDIFNGERWDYDVIPKISGNKGTSWIKQRVNLLPYAGDTIVIRFRGKTGDDYQSDISIDDINIFENTQSPAAAFDQDNNQTCIDGVVNFTDLSTNSPTSWQWDIQPNTFSFVNGTNATAQDISVQFHNVGTYQVSLTAINGFGNDSVLKVNAVVVDPGKAPPIFEDFEIAVFPPLEWQLDNPDGFISWKSSNVTGSNGSTSKVALFDNFSGANLGENDGLVSFNIDLRNISNPILFFDVAHGPKPGKEDSLIIDISDNCGFEYQLSAYQKSSSQLQTATPTTSLFVPASAADWRRDTLDLSPYIGSNVTIRFRNYSDAGNAIYLDNIQLVSSSVQAPVSNFSISDTLACINSPVVFTDLSSGGTATSYTWNFGPNAIPNSAGTAGPHNVQFIRTGMQTVTLTVSNGGGFSQKTIMVDVKQKPVSLFNFTNTNPLTVQFTDISLYGPTEWLWVFGDGDSSTLQNPLHTYDTAGTYTVYQKVSNRCGFTERTVTLVLLSNDEASELYAINLYPNPNNGRFNLSVDNLAGQSVRVEVLDLSGKIIRSLEEEIPGGSGTLEFDLSHASPGIYMVRLTTEEATHTLRTIKR